MVISSKNDLFWRENIDTIELCGGVNFIYAESQYEHMLQKFAELIALISNVTIGMRNLKVLTDEDIESMQKTIKLCDKKDGEKKAELLCRYSLISY